ncbi:nacht and ankyrin domain protein [Colletotrichum karsti]|uniref:Nacht and ankyrin domain protein n=1 Tax=Colletotrichum karsti TaxID=1095194 RepID=A0A9P6I8H8_9PEZI|nr:nacht and ankyrin domain protein [Colletotrichum karsti]KAF9878313.1 nacht and ankyrin domain protein [Colletotrichum karsti]
MITLSRTRFPGSTVPLSLPGRNLSIALPGDGVQTLFRHSKEYVPVPGLFDALSVFFGLTASDFAIFDHDHIEAFEDRDAEGFRTNHADPSRRIIEHQRRDFTKFLNGDSLREIMKRFSHNFEVELRGQVAESSSPTQLPDLYRFVRDAIFKAEVEALYGEHVFSVCPTFCEDFWEFYDAFPVISRKLPRWMFPSKYQKRDKMLKNFQAWRQHCHSLFDWNNEELVNSDYEPIWGTRYVRRMVQRHEKLGFSDPGISTVMLGYLFV